MIRADYNPSVPWSLDVHRYLTIGIGPDGKPRWDGTKHGDVALDDVRDAESSAYERIAKLWQWIDAMEGRHQP